MQLNCLRLSLAIGPVLISAYAHSWAQAVTLIRCAAHACHHLAAPLALAFVFELASAALCLARLFLSCLAFVFLFPSSFYYTCLSEHCPAGQQFHSSPCQIGTSGLPLHGCWRNWLTTAWATLSRSASGSDVSMRNRMLLLIVAIIIILVLLMLLDILSPSPLPYYCCYSSFFIAMPP